MNLVIHIYLEDFYDINASPTVKTYPFIHFGSLVLNFQLESLYNFSIVG